MGGGKFRRTRDKAEILTAVENFAQVVLLMDNTQPILPRCEKCSGIKLTETVFDSIHDGPFPLSGSGRTRRRDVQYCPKCEPKPQGGFLDKDPADEKEEEMLRRMRENQ